MDLRLRETGYGGDLVLRGSDLLMTSGWTNMPYLGMFGGNLAAVTRGPKPEGQEAHDWWGNNLLMQNNKALQFNSETEKKLQEVALNSAGRIQIENIIRSDLSFMKELAEITVSASILSTDQVHIQILVREPGNLEAKEFKYLWDGMRLEAETLESTKTPYINIPGFSSGFSPGFG